MADWVEVFAPVVFERYRRSAWPEEGSLLVDHLPFRVRSFDEAGFSVPAGDVAFDDVIGALGYEQRRPMLWRLLAVTTVNADDWERFFRSLEGTPQRVVSDAHSGISAAIKRVWSDTDHYLSDWHLQYKLQRRLTGAKLHSKDHPLQQALQGALTGLAFWDNFIKLAQEHKATKALQWIERWDPVVRSQMERRPPSYKRTPDYPLTTGALESKLDSIKAWIGWRRYAFKNRERLNRLLMLMQLELNDQADEVKYAKHIRAWLLAHGGRPRGARRAIADPLGSPSLRKLGRRVSDTPQSRRHRGGQLAPGRPQ